MNCETARQMMMLAEYGELTFEEENELEQHLDGCAECQVERGKVAGFEAVLASVEEELPAGLLARCRRDLAAKIDEESLPSRRFSPANLWRKWVVHPPMWLRPVGAMAMLAVGFFAAQVAPEVPALAALTGAKAGEAGVARVRLVNQGEQGQVRVLYDEVRQKEMTGSLQDEQIRRLLLAAASDPSDPGLRVESVDLLKNHCERDEVRKLLLHALVTDPNSGVRLKALEGLKPYARDEETREVLARVVQRDDNPGVRVQAIDLLLQSKEPEIAGLLQELLRREENSYIRSRSQKALRDMKASIDTF